MLTKQCLVNIFTCPIKIFLFSFLFVRANLSGCSEIWEPYNWPRMTDPDIKFLASFFTYIPRGNSGKFSFVGNTLVGMSFGILKILSISMLRIAATETIFVAIAINSKCIRTRTITTGFVRNKFGRFIIHFEDSSS